MMRRSCIPSLRIAMLLFVALLFFCKISFGQWISKQNATWVIREFDLRDKSSVQRHLKADNRRPSYPFITGDGFRDFCRKHICETEEGCKNFDADAVKSGDCIFVKIDFFDYFVRKKATSIRKQYILVAHNSDISAPDGQTDAPKIELPRYTTTDILRREHASGRLLAVHAQNLWWTNYTDTPRPEFLHCLPIGFENRRYKIGRNIAQYQVALRKFVLDAKEGKSNFTSSSISATASAAKTSTSTPTYSASSTKPLLLVAFEPTSCSPDRRKVLQILHEPNSSHSEDTHSGDAHSHASATTAAAAASATVAADNTQWYTRKKGLKHAEWLQAITEHRFVLAPHGHGLDTHRISEILTMGGIPVMRRSTISSCYDDSDNVIGRSKRGSLPVVILDSWEELSEARLEQEWKRLTAVPTEHWDWKRLFIYHWFDRINETRNLTSSRHQQSRGNSPPLKFREKIKLRDSYQIKEE